jgi:hypothetical protein
MTVSFDRAVADPDTSAATAATAMIAVTLLYIGIDPLFYRS